MDKLTARQRALLERELNGKAASFAPIVHFVIDNREVLYTDEAIFAEFESKIQEWLEQHPNTDAVVLKRLLSMIFESEEVTGMYVNIMEFGGVLLKTGDGISGTGSYSASLKSAGIRAN